MISDLTVIFALLGSTCLKAAHKILMKLTPGWLSYVNLCKKYTQNENRALHIVL